MVRFGPNVYARYSLRDSFLEQDEERHRPDPGANRGHRDHRRASTIATFSPENVEELGIRPRSADALRPRS
jgi:hypothetical protein